MHEFEDDAWYALHVKARHEHLVAYGLAQLRVPCFLPTYTIHSERTTHDISINKPLFAGYVFCNLDLARGPKLYHLPGLLRIVGTGRHPAKIPNDDIEAIRRVVMSNIQVSPCPFLARGDEVTVIEGPLRGITGLYVYTEAAGQLIVSVPLLQRSINVRLDPRWVKPSRSVNADVKYDLPIAS
jgi:transcription antitermination factor NusG